MRAGFTMSELSEKVGTNRNRVSAWESGQLAPPDRARLQDLAAVLELSSREADDLFAAAHHFKQSRLENSLEDVSGGGIDIHQMVFQLYEWQTVHTHARELHFSILAMDRHLSLSTDNNIDTLIDIWFNMCEPKAQLAKRRFIEFEWINHKIISDYCLFINGNEVPLRLSQMNHDDTETLNNLRNAIMLLESLVLELLTVADFYMSDLLERLKASLSIIDRKEVEYIDDRKEVEYIDDRKEVEYIDLTRFPCLGLPESVTAVNRLFQRSRESTMQEITMTTDCEAEEVVGMFYLLLSHDAAEAFILMYHKKHANPSVASHRIPLAQGFPQVPLRCSVCGEEIESIDEVSFDLQFQLTKDIEFVSEVIHG